eukprot:CAMPEP_0198366498 /NCGR_PEP_ID=MMETSP1450-20131203/154709_1 /TAXON_ID=753684 ORGANISM="Madagascaria erythrocladiodes, Strain CCMP3234" /NCGR_SAMPLE_ID=MMETSP1450 /ASSEMBLY_ACC=CAM_ASM_001115 /LENGTH=907 /DNA_ID=CAMNT_0044073965 /DNA_START=33 /DNA_END=2760 /DNA_ORIENTATION=+
MSAEDTAPTQAVAPAAEEPGPTAAGDGAEKEAGSGDAAGDGGAAAPPPPDSAGPPAAAEPAQPAEAAAAAAQDDDDDEDDEPSVGDVPVAAKEVPEPDAEGDSSADQQVTAEQAADELYVFDRVEDEPESAAEENDPEPEPESAPEPNVDTAAPEAPASSTTPTVPQHLPTDTAAKALGEAPAEAPAEAPTEAPADDPADEPTAAPAQVPVPPPAQTPPQAVPTTPTPAPTQLPEPPTAATTPTASAPPLTTAPAPTPADTSSAPTPQTAVHDAPAAKPQPEPHPEIDFVIDRAGASTPLQPAPAPAQQKAPAEDAQPAGTPQPGQVPAAQPGPTNTPTEQTEEQRLNNILNPVPPPGHIPKKTSPNPQPTQTPAQPIEQLPTPAAIPDGEDYPVTAEGYPVGSLPRHVEVRPNDSRVFIGNLATEDIGRKEVLDIFAKHGRLIEEPVIRRSFGFVQYGNPQAAARAIAAEDGKYVANMRIDLSLADGRERRTPAEKARAREAQRQVVGTVHRKRGRSPSPPRGQGGPFTHRGGRNIDLSDRRNRSGVTCRVLAMGPQAHAYAHQCESTIQNMLNLSCDVVYIEAQKLGEHLLNALEQRVPYVIVVAIKDQRSGTCTIRTLEQSGYEKAGSQQNNGIVPFQEALEVLMRRENIAPPNMPGRSLDSGGGMRAPGPSNFPMRPGMMPGAGRGVGFGGPDPGMFAGGRGGPPFDQRNRNSYPGYPPQNPAGPGMMGMNPGMPMGQINPSMMPQFQQFGQGAPSNMPVPPNQSGAGTGPDLSKLQSLLSTMSQWQNMQQQQPQQHQQHQQQQQQAQQRPSNPGQPPNMPLGSGQNPAMAGFLGNPALSAMMGGANGMNVQQGGYAGSMGTANPPPGMPQMGQPMNPAMLQFLQQQQQQQQQHGPSNPYRRG